MRAADRLEQTIEPGALLLFDTSVVLAYLDGREATSPLAAALFDGFVSTGRNGAAISAITAGEILVRPFRAGQAAVSTVEGFLRFFAEIRIVEADYEVAREAARIRAATGMHMPDALVVASAFAAKADVLVTNDRSWRSALEIVRPGLDLCVLEDLAG